VEQQIPAHFKRSPVRLAVALLAVCGGMLLAQQPVDMSLLGPGIGTAAPAFSGRDQYGKTQTLDTMMGSEGLMLVFFRSADW
jgi:hypothetical protein